MHTSNKGRSQIALPEIGGDRLSASINFFLAAQSSKPQTSKQDAYVVGASERQGRSEMK